jgi:hypothetical protein
MPTKKTTTDPGGYAPSWYGVEDDEYLDSLPKDEATRKALARDLMDLMERQKALKKGALSDTKK